MKKEQTENECEGQKCGVGQVHQIEFDKPVLTQKKHTEKSKEEKKRHHENTMDQIILWHILYESHWKSSHDTDKEENGGRSQNGRENQ